MNSYYSTVHPNENSWHFKMLPVESRIRLRSQPDGECMIYMGQRTDDGYGIVRVDRKHQMVHKVMWEAENGPVPDGLQLDHKCNNEPCWNLEHIRPLTPRENVLRSSSPASKNAKKTHCVNGHELAGDNLRLYRNKIRGVERVCRQCKRDRNAVSRSRNRLSDV